MNLYYFFIFFLALGGSFIGAMNERSVRYQEEGGEFAQLMYQCRHCRQSYIVSRGTYPSGHGAYQACWDCSRKIPDLEEAGCPVCERKRAPEDILSSDKRCKECKKNNMHSRQEFDKYFHTARAREGYNLEEAEKFLKSQRTWNESWAQEDREKDALNAPYMKKRLEELIFPAYQQQKAKEKKLIILAATVLAAGIYYTGKKIYNKMRKKSATTTPTTIVQDQELSSSNEE